MQTSAKRLANSVDTERNYFSARYRLPRSGLLEPFNRADLREKPRRPLISTFGVMKLVIDSNQLQTDRLYEFLAQSPNNAAVLPDFAAMEAYKGD